MVRARYHNRLNFLGHGSHFQYRGQGQQEVTERGPQYSPSPLQIQPEQWVPIYHSAKPPQPPQNPGWAVTGWQRGYEGAGTMAPRRM